MKELVDFMKSHLGHTETSLVARTAEHLYFRTRNRILPSCRGTPEFRLVRDLLSIEEALNSTNTIRKLKLRSEVAKDNETVQELKEVEILQPHQAQRLRDRVIEPKRYLISAVLLTDLLQQEARKERFRWLFATSVTIVATIVTATISILRIFHGSN